MYTAPPHNYTLSLHDALPIFDFWPTFAEGVHCRHQPVETGVAFHCNAQLAGNSGEQTDDVAFGLFHRRQDRIGEDRKSTRLNSSHVRISYAVFCLKKKSHMSS